MQRLINAKRLLLCLLSLAWTPLGRKSAAGPRVCGIRPALDSTSALSFPAPGLPFPFSEPRFDLCFPGQTALASGRRIDEGRNPRCNANVGRSFL